MLRKLLFACLAMLIVIPVSIAAKTKSDSAYSIAYVYDYTGECEVKKKGEDIAEAIQDLYIPLYEGDTLLTGDESTMEIIFDDSTMLRLDPRCKLTIKTLNRKSNNKTVVELLKGRVIAIVKKLFEKEEFTVKTKMAMAAVKGTEFIVDASNDDTVGVYDGAVEVSGMDMDGNVLHKIVLKKDEETIVTKKLRKPERAKRLNKDFVKRYKEVKDLRQKIQMMRDLRRSGRAKEFKLERRLKRIENLKTMMRSDPQRFRNLPAGERALVEEIMKQEPYLKAQEESVKKDRKSRTSRLKGYLKDRKSKTQEATEEETPEEAE